MTPNNNGKVRLGTNASTNIGNTVLGVVPNSNTVMSLRFTAGVTMAMTIDDLELQAPGGLLNKLIKDTNPNSPTFGTTLSEEPSGATWQVVDWPYFMLIADDFGNPVNPPKYYFEAREGFDPRDRRWSNNGTSYNFPVLVTTAVLEPGSYKGEIVIVSNGTFCGKLLLTLEVQDVDQMFAGEPNLVRYHLVP